jgi:phosphomannomutase
MKELGAPLAGEMSAHLFVADGYYGYDDAIYAALRVLSILQKSDGSLADFCDSLPLVVNTPELLVPCPETASSRSSKRYGRGSRPGVPRSIAPTACGCGRAPGWWLLRASNTQDILVLRCEAPDMQKLRALMDRVRAGLMASGLDPTGF